MWELTPRRGSSALIDTLRHIAAKDSGWDHAVVGWTGEIQEMSARAGPLLPQGSRAVQVNGGRQPPLGPRSRSYYTPPPVPVFGGTNNRMTMKADCSRDRPEEEQVPCVDKVKKEDLQRVLAERSREDGWNKVRAVWLGDEEDRGVALTGMDRWVHYAEKGLSLWLYVPRTILTFHSSLAHVSLYYPSDIPTGREPGSSGEGLVERLSLI